jgi:hypothetical protein
MWNSMRRKGDNFCPFLYEETKNESQAGGEGMLVQRLNDGLSSNFTRY